MDSVNHVNLVVGDVINAKVTAVVLDVFWGCKKALAQIDDAAVLVPASHEIINQLVLILLTKKVINGNNERGVTSSPSLNFITSNPTFCLFKAFKRSANYWNSSCSRFLAYKTILV